jgi:hypothetical protein
MDNSGQQAFIGRIRSALGHVPDARRSRKDLCTSQFTEETGAILDRIKNRSAGGRQQLIDRLMEMAAPINLKVTVLKDRTAATAAIGDLVRDKAPEFGDRKQVVRWQHPLLESLNLADARLKTRRCTSPNLKAPPPTKIPRTRKENEFEKTSLTLTSELLRLISAWPKPPPWSCEPDRGRPAPYLSSLPFTSPSSPLIRSSPISRNSTL